MATERQIEANRQNSCKSTGPKTEAGKAASSANALSHGLTADLAVLLPDEDAGAYEQLRQGVITDLEPAGVLQRALAERVAVLLWRLDRAARLEAELFIHGEIALERSSLDQAQTRALTSRLLADQLGEEAMEVRKKRMQERLHLDASSYAEAPCARVLVERRDSARTYDQLARHEATLQRALNRTLDEFRRLRDASGAAAKPHAATPAESPDPEPAPTATADSDEALSRDARPSATQSPRPPAGGASGVTGQDREKTFLQNEANSAQEIEGAADSGSRANPPVAPPVF